MPALQVRIARTFKLGIKSLLVHKLRSGLTMLGLVFGVFSVIAMLAIGEGSKREALEQIRQLGANTIIVRSVKPPEDSSQNVGRSSYVAEYGLKYTDFDRVADTVPSVTNAIPIREMRKQFWYLHRSLDGRLVATTRRYIEANRLEMARGRWLTDQDERLGDNVTVLAHGTADKLFPYEDPIGKAVRVGTEYYRIVGVTRFRTASAAIGGSLAGQDYNYDLYIPMSTYRSRVGEISYTRRTGSREVEKIELSQFTLTVTDTSVVDATSKIVERLLARFHQRADYAVVVPLELLRQEERTRQIFNFVLGSVAAISLIVGGIGIMNIMLATVTERTREIGIRRALGAKRRDIVIQFLVECVVLSATGGLVGVLLGVLIPSGLTSAVDYFFHQSVKTAITLWSPLLAFSISVAVGIIFGLYPARRAALMDPIEALRHE